MLCFNSAATIVYIGSNYMEKYISTYIFCHCVHYCQKAFSQEKYPASLKLILQLAFIYQTIIKRNPGKSDVRL